MATVWFQFEDPYPWQRRQKALAAIFGLCCYQSVPPSGQWVLKLKGLSCTPSTWCHWSTGGLASTLWEHANGANGRSSKSLWLRSHLAIDGAGKVSQETSLVICIRMVGFILPWAGNLGITFGVGAVNEKVIWQSHEWVEMWKLVGETTVPLERKRCGT